MKLSDELTPLTERELEERFEDMLDSCYEPVRLDFGTFDYSRLLKTLDQVAYREALCDWLDNEQRDSRIIEEDGEYYVLDADAQRILDIQEEIEDWKKDNPDLTARLSGDPDLLALTIAAELGIN